MSFKILASCQDKRSRNTVGKNTSARFFLHTKTLKLSNQSQSQPHGSGIVFVHMICQSSFKAACIISHKSYQKKKKKTSYQKQRTCSNTRAIFLNSHFLSYTSSLEYGSQACRIQQSVSRVVIRDAAFFPSTFPEIKHDRTEPAKTAQKTLVRWESRRPTQRRKLNFSEVRVKE